jgi:hypothetical protein
MSPANSIHWGEPIPPLEIEELSLNPSEELDELED